ncbi:MAG: hypothetical protein JO121_20245 [Deltaproteobacteria bacterium]|nr:hypothetical protein [Deltaproteobacteria bacterium]
MILWVMLIGLSPDLAYGHGVVGDRTFLSPIVGNDAFPDNAASLTSRRSDYAFSLLPALEKQLGDSSSLLLTGGWDKLEPEAGPDTSGPRDLSIYFRQSAYVSPAHEFEFTVSPFLVVPTGTREIADEGYTHLGGELLVGKGLGDLPDEGALNILRPLAIQVEAGYAGRLQGPANSDVFANFEVEYSLSYLERFVEPIGTDRPWRDLVPYTELDYSQALIASRLTTLPDFRLTPGLAYLGDYCEVSMGAQVALNGAAQPGDRVAVIGLIEVFYDGLFPALAWKPF